MSSGTQGPASLLGRVIGGYRLARVLGKGATGVVFLGTRTDAAQREVERTGQSAVILPEQAAIKVLFLPWQLDDAERLEFRRRFLREAHTLSVLDHPNILAVLLWGEDDATGSSYMVLPFIAGGTLQDRLASQTQPMSLAVVETIITQLASAIDFAHKRGIVHRDIKPGNILLGDGNHVYLSDFSIARLLSETATHLTRTGNALGTPIYMPPEALAGQAAEPTTDVFSLGMVAYELVVGLRTSLTNPPPPPRTLRPELPQAAEAAILMAIDPDPQKRFQEAPLFSNAFGEGLQGIWSPGLTKYVEERRDPIGMGRGTLTLSNVPDPSREKEHAERTRHPSLIILSLVLALALVGAGALGTLAFFQGRGNGLTSNILGSQSPSSTARSPQGSPNATISGATATAESGGVSGSGGGGGTGGGAGGGVTPTKAPTKTAVPEPGLVVSTDGSQSTDGQSHGAGNPYFIGNGAHYGSVTIQAGAYATAADHCGGGSGIVRFSATGTVRIDGTLTVDGAGYCGGPAVQGAAGGKQGDSYTGSGTTSTAANGGGGGGGNGADSGGGGAGYGSPGAPAVNGSDISPPSGGNTYGDPTISVLQLGSGGGSSGAVSANVGAAGGNGGGAISITAGTIIVNGRISANGDQGKATCAIGSSNNCRGGGGGSGGSIFLHANAITLGNGRVTATGGQGGQALRPDGRPATGGDGGVGRIRVEYTQSFSGSTNPAASVAKV